MAPKKKNKKKSAKSKKSAGRKSTPAQKRVQKRKTLKKSAKGASAPKKAAAKRKSSRKTISGKTASVRNKKTGKRNREPEGFGFSRDIPASLSGEESGDLQGLSNVATADSESVDELLEEGNAFEAGVVSGVERAGEREGREVHTREVPEDDVPGEYLDEE
jgi:hypothetical protein